jgi:chemotaxis protein MotA
VVGLFVGIGSLVLSGVMELHHLNPDVNAFLKPSALLIIFGGTLGATMASVSWHSMMKFPVFLKKAFFEEHRDTRALIPQLVSFAEKARREGILALQDNVEEISETYCRKGLQLIIDGTSPETVGEILDAEIDIMKLRHKEGQEIFMLMGGFSPTMGIVGTVLGLIAALSEAARGATTEVVVAAIATAFIATFYGIGAANLLWLPLQSKLKALSEEESFYRETIKEGVLSIQGGENPRIVEEKLLVFLSDRDRAGVMAPSKTSA